MKKLSIISLFALLLLSASCTDNGEATISDHPPFVFGISYGFCQGNCTHLFKYENGEVFRDEMDRIDLNNLVFSRTADPDITSVGQKILDQLPEELKSNTEDTYGCPDCADQGTLIIQLTEDDNTRLWRLDTRVQEDWSKELSDFVTLLKAELEEIIIL